MLVSHRKRFIYVKTVKTASTSVEHFFEPWCRPEGIAPRGGYDGPEGIVGRRDTNAAQATYWNHMNAAQIRAAVGDELWSRYLTFCVVRDPFDRLVSAFNFMEFRVKNGRANERVTKMFAAFEASNSVENFRAWLASDAARLVVINDRRRYMDGNTPCLDVMLRFERLGEDIEQLCDHLQIPFAAESIPHINGNTRQRSIPLSQWYNAEAEERVRVLCRPEFAHCGYNPALDRPREP